MSALVKHMLAGQVDKARTIHFEIFELCQTMFVETNPIPIKAALGLMGKIEPEFRLPLCAPSPANLEKIRTALGKLNLI